MKKQWSGNVKLLFALVLCSWFSATSLSLYAWGQEGHRIVAKMAERLLTPEAKTQIQKILKSETMADVANWADAIKKARPETAPFHFIDFPAAVQQPLVEEEREGRLIKAIRDFKTVLADPQEAETARYEALKFFIHLMGDLHQPLHCAPKGDHGGNDIRVTYMGMDTNLHKLWDTGLLGSANVPEDDYVEALEQDLNESDAAAFAKGSFRDWAYESDAIARFHSYVLPPNHVLDERYYDANIRSLNRQLIKAGVRLADQLNEIFSN